MQLRIIVSSAIDKETAEALQREANERGWSVSKVVREHLSRQVKSRVQQPAPVATKP